MIVDSSALVAVLLKEPGHEVLVRTLEAAATAGVGAPTLVETGIVLVARLGIMGKTLLARFVTEAGLEVVPLTEEHWPVAVDAFSRYGKGRHAAALNFGDCLAYAAAVAANDPLLFVGDDFKLTDVARA